MEVDIDILSGCVAGAALLFSIGTFIYQQVRQSRQDAALETERAERKADAAAEAIRRNEEMDLVRAQLDSLERQTKREERAQAEGITVELIESDLVPDAFVEVPDDAAVYAVRITNGSELPIRDVRGGIRFGDVGQRYSYAAAYVLERAVGQRLALARPFRQGNQINFVEPGETYQILFAYGTVAAPNGRLAVRFEDQEGEIWQVGPDRRLVDYKPEEWAP
jgi:hypothetical protein